MSVVTWKSWMPDDINYNDICEFDGVIEGTWLSDKFGQFVVSDDVKSWLNAYWFIPVASPEYYCIW